MTRRWIAWRTNVPPCSIPRFLLQPFCSPGTKGEQNRDSGNIRSVCLRIQCKQVQVTGAGFTRHFTDRILTSGLIVLLWGKFGFTQVPPSPQAPQSSTEIPGTKVNVISTTPLPGVDLEREKIAAPVQVG